jgi:protein-disulfide isomerase
MPYERLTYRRAVLVAFMATFVFAAVPACGQTAGEVAALRKELDALKASHAALRKDVDELREVLKPTPPKSIMDAPPGMTLPLSDAPSRGAAGAKIVMLEFSDYECAFCGRFVRDSYPAIDREFIQTGKVRQVFRAFPLESIHKNAFKAHEAAACAGDQGKYWPMHDRLFANQRALTVPDLTQHARTVGLDMALFSTCLDSGRMAARIKKDLDAGARVGVQGTPLFLIGTVGADGQLVVKKGISGAQPFTVFKQAFEDVAAGR